MKYLVFFFFIVLSISSQAQKVKITKSKTSQIIPINYNWERLPDNFHILNGNELYSSISNTFKLSKSEFETTKNFEQRKKQRLIQPIVGNLTVDSTLYVEIIQNKEDILNPCEYNADTQELSVNFGFTSTFEVTVLNYNNDYFQSIRDSLPYSQRNNYPSLSMLKIYQREKDLGSYKGQNAFGVKKTVDKYLYTQIYLVLQDSSSFIPKRFFSNNVSIKSFLEDIILKFPIEPNNAKEAKKNLKIIAFLKLYEPYFDEDTKHDPATIDLPVSITEERYFIFANIEKIWFYNSTTRQIYHKFNFRK